MTPSRAYPIPQCFPENLVPTLAQGKKDYPFDVSTAMLKAELFHPLNTACDIANTDNAVNEFCSNQIIPPGYRGSLTIRSTEKLSARICGNGGSVEARADHCTSGCHELADCPQESSSGEKLSDMRCDNGKLDDGESGIADDEIGYKSSFKCIRRKLIGEECGVKQGENQIPDHSLCNGGIRGSQRVCGKSDAKLVCVTGKCAEDWDCPEDKVCSGASAETLGQCTESVTDKVVGQIGDRFFPVQVGTLFGNFPIKHSENNTETKDFVFQCPRNGQIWKALRPGRYHEGIDITPRRHIIDDVAARSLAIVAFAAGKVESAKVGFVTINHSAVPGLENVATRYIHLSSVFVQSGDFVDAGEVIGTMGDVETSNVHLHWEYYPDWKNKVSADPLTILYGSDESRGSLMPSDSGKLLVYLRPGGENSDVKGKARCELI